MKRTTIQEEQEVDKTNHINHGKQMRVVLLCGFLIAAAAFSGCSSSLKLSSAWRQEDIVIDGSDTEWQRGQYYDKESDIVYSIRNDDDYVYLFLKTQNRTTQMQIIRAGFTVWFDADGGNDHSFGIRYPLARQDARLEFHPESDEEQIHSAFEQAVLELEIVGAQKENVQRFSTLDVPGIRVKIGRSQEALVYELRVPLRKTPHTPFAIGVTSENRIGIGLETEEFNREKMKMGAHKNEGLSGSEPGDSQMEGGEHEGRGYHDGGRRGDVRENKEKPRQLGLWLSVQLAHMPNAEQKKKN
ncbi:MAG: hypothetical protein ABSD46_00565 [Bacteroidota bacterium]